MSLCRWEMKNAQLSVHRSGLETLRSRFSMVWRSDKGPIAWIKNHDQLRSSRAMFMATDFIFLLASPSFRSHTWHRLNSSLRHHSTGWVIRRSIGFLREIRFVWRGSECDGRSSCTVSRLATQFQLRTNPPRARNVFDRPGLQGAGAHQRKPYHFD